MRTVDTRWQNVAAGLSRAEQLERELNDEWVPRLEEHLRRRFERERIAWQARQELNRRRFEEQLAAWRARYAERCRDVEDELPLWTRACSSERQRLMARARWGGLSALAILAAATVFALLAAPKSESIFAAAAALSLAFGPALLSWRRLAHLRREKPSPHRADDPEPQLPADEREPILDGRDPLPLTIVQQWWDGVSYERSALRSDATYGDEGEEGLWNHLVERLPDQYVAVRNLPVSTSLDVDVLVVGPTGIWILESKYWAGEISCRQGRWSQTRTWFEAGGHEVAEEKPIKRPPDEQWLREEQAVKKTLQRRLSQPAQSHLAITGGVVDTHPTATWNIDTSCRAEVGPPEHWARTILHSSALPQLTPENQLRVIEALLKWAHRLDKELIERPFNESDAKARAQVEEARARVAAVCSSVELAQRLFSDATNNARAYLET